MDIVDLYLEHGDFRTAVRLSGLPMHIAHIKLGKAGVLKIADKIQFGSKGAKLGGQAEQLFQTLVPDAVDANALFKKNNPVYDFVFKNMTIDVKYSSLYSGGKSYHWGIRCKGEQDFIVAFLEREQGTGIDSPYCLLIPMDFVDVKQMHISPSGSWFKEFQVELEELRGILNDYAELREIGQF